MVSVCTNRSQLEKAMVAGKMRCPCTGSSGQSCLYFLNRATTTAVASIRSSLVLPPNSPSTATVSFPNSNSSITTLTPERFESDPSPPAEISCGQSFLVVGQTPQPPT